MAMTPVRRAVAEALPRAAGSCNGAPMGLSTTPGCGEVDRTPGRFTGRVIDPTRAGCGEWCHGIVTGQADRKRDSLSGAAAVLGGSDRLGRLRRGADRTGGGYSGFRCRDGIAATDPHSVAKGYSPVHGYPLAHACSPTCNGDPSSHDYSPVHRDPRVYAHNPTRSDSPDCELAEDS